jgi:hypothetical protein
MRHIALFFFIHVVTACVAQTNYGFEEAFILTKQGDSLRGFLEVAPSYGSQIGFKREMNDAVRFISTKEIKYVATPNRYLENVPLGKRELLMTLVADGKARLFLQVVSRASVRQSRFGSSAYESRDYVFVVKKGSIYTEVPKKNYREMLSALLYDCPEVVQKLREKVFAYEQMDLVVAEYNSCL